ncbi:MAG: class I SAM-dependent methyltransferase [Chitinophagia bacterium]|nr:class I SAM-dependent methyltransferase [Chitinophagia bacterium]
MNTKLTSKDILKMSYVQFIAFLKETNRCPGGKKSIRLILQNTFANSNSRILEIGSNTGFTSLEIARITAREVIGIEPIQEAVDESNNLLMSDTQEIQQKVRFLKASAYDIPFTKEAFDIFPAVSLAVAVKLCVPSFNGVPAGTINDQLPFKSTAAVPNTTVPSITVIVVKGFAVPVMVGVAVVAIPAVVMTGAAGAVVMTEIFNGSESADALPAVSTDIAVRT